ncbi:alpha-L-fucosidase [Granulicella sp. S156]|uniref:alpha-L-fucosidase n=1 Tax=Granulicella sp. S156 TaxID=1747224 RepID=UPI0020B149FC|nr:alpha-L-fucosidase [Granulicella sp. S156]
MHLTESKLMKKQATRIPMSVAIALPLLLAALPKFAVAQASAHDLKHPANAPSLDQPRPLPGPRPTQATIEQWKDRKFGMFIHFGLYSTLGGVWDGKQIDNGYSEQIMANAPIPLDKYAALAANFNPTRFDPDAIVALAKAAGMKFIVITAKHHDGFNMFHTQQTPYNIVDATPYHKDVVKQLEEACARAGMKFGVYYSSIDWHYPGASSYIEGNSNPIPPAHEDFNVAQLKELLTNYGPLSEIWFDMGKPTPLQSERFTRTVHDLQSQTMVSGRVFNYQGDFTVMGDNQVPDFVIDEPWQTPASIFPETWGYRSWQRRDDLQGKIHENILRLAQVVSRGGNFILNIGPAGDGSIVPFEADVLRGIGRWISTNGEAIYGTDPQPFRQLDFGYATVGKGKLYLFLHNPDSKSGNLRLPGLETSLQHAYLLGDPAKTELAIHRDATGVSISTENLGAILNRLRATQKDGSSENTFLPVIVASFAGELKVRPAAIAPEPDGHFVLGTGKADHFVNYNGYGYEAPSTVYKLRWHVASTAGLYRVALRYKPSQTPASVDLVVNGRRQPIQLASTSASGDGTAVLDHIRIENRAVTSIEITPPEPFYKGTKLPDGILSLELTPEPK